MLVISSGDISFAPGTSPMQVSIFWYRVYRFGVVTGNNTEFSVLISSGRVQPAFSTVTLVQPSDSAQEPQAVGKASPRSLLHCVLLQSANSRMKPSRPMMTTSVTKMLQKTILRQPGFSCFYSSSTLGTGLYSAISPLRLNSLLSDRLLSPT